MAIGGCANVHVVESLLLTDGMLGMDVFGIVEVMSIMGNPDSKSMCSLYD